VGCRTRRLASLLAPALVAAALGCREDAESPMGPESTIAPATVSTAQALSFRQVSAGFAHSCGVTTDDRAFCWGDGGLGQLGNGTTGQHWRPVAVLGGLKFLQVRAGWGHSCGLTTDYRVYCWGGNYSGQLGDGTTTNRLTPVAVAGGRRFPQVCAVTLFGRAFCWGLNGYGQLGDGTKSTRLTPVNLHANGREFRQVIAGGFHTCGVTTGSQAYCWGRNDNGELGDGTLHIRLTPVAVVGGLSFRQVIAGVGRPLSHAHTCGVTTGNQAYCWGDNRNGRLGDGTTSRRVTPTPVSGGLQFSGVTLGSSHTCAVTTADRGYCWGWNFYGQLGDGTHTNRLVPVAVSGDLQFTRVSAGGGGVHTCAVTGGGEAYCWGANYAGQLGDGTTTERMSPVPVAGPE
jgi:alpha-tubulin suppressor-like RCC1 family protein